MINQPPLTKMQKYLKRYASASPADKKTIREYKMVSYDKYVSQCESENHDIHSFDTWCEIMRNVKGYSVSHAEIKQRLNVSDGWINNNIKPVVRWFRTKATKEKGESSVFYNRDDLNNYLLNCCNFAMRTVLIDVTDDSQFNYAPDILSDIERFKELYPHRNRLKGYAKNSLVNLRSVIDSKIPEFINAIDPAVRCPAVEISIRDLGIPDLWSCKFHTVDDLETTSDPNDENKGKRKYTGSEMFERAMYRDGCIRIALSGYDSNNSCKKKVYIDFPTSENIDRTKLVRVSVQDFLARDHVLPKLKMIQPLIEEQTQEISAQHETNQVESNQDAQVVDPLVNLSQEQREMVDAFLTGERKNLFITGGAGTGKTFLTKAIIERLIANYKNVLICSPTAIAALNIDENHGRTLHSVFGISQNEVIPYDTNGNPNVSESIINADVIVIDEISMVRMDVFKYVVKTIEAAEKIRYDRLISPDLVGGYTYKQCLFVGDFFQLSPVVTKEDKAELFANGWSLEALDRGGFCFFTEEWQTRINKDNFLELKKTYRQSDGEFITMLNDLRKANNIAVKDRLRKWLNKFVRTYPYTEQGKIIELCPTNALVEAINSSNLNMLPDEEKIYEAVETYYNPSQQKQFTRESSHDTSSVDSSDKKEHTPIFREIFNFDRSLTLKVGAKVIMTISSGSKFTNGQRGIISKLNDDTIYVKLLKNGKYGRPTAIKRHTFYALLYMKPNGDNSDIPNPFVVEQFPLRVAYAISIHKAQGMTLSGVCIHPQVFAPGELYVALSRVTDSANLYLSDKISRRYIKTSQDVIYLYNHNASKFPLPYQKTGATFRLVYQFDTIVNKIDKLSATIPEENTQFTTSLETITKELKDFRRALVKSQIK